MIRNLGKVFITLCLLTIGGGIVANAQIGAGAQVQANVPFAFAVGDTTLPAGKYQIRRPYDSEPSVLEISNGNGRTRVLFEASDAQTGADQPASKSEFIFDKVGNQYFLSQVWVAGSLSGSELPKSKVEKRLADGGSNAEKHSVAAFMKRFKP